MRSFLCFLLLFLQVLRSSAQTTVVGSTEGVFDVSDLGSASYSIPIKVPDGAGGLQPNVSLTYSSNGGNGPLGMGWSVTGLSAITRTGNNIYNDKNVAGAALTNADKFSLDGNRMMNTNGAYGAAGSTYRTELETFKTIVASATLIGSGPESFKVTDQDGVVYEYGTVANARAISPGKTEPYMWMLNKVTDLKGNFMTFEYVNTNGEILPSIIKYNSHQTTGVAFKSYLYFSYTTTADPNFAYLAGGQIPMTKKIDMISSVQEVGTLWRYFRTYTPTYTDDFYTHLVRVTEKGADETEGFPATEFSYNPATASSVTEQHAEIATGVGYNYAAGDYNGDGRTDIVRYSESNGGPFTLYLNTAASGPGQFSPVQNGTMENGFANVVVENLLKDRQSQTIPFDYNGDGKEDFAVFQSFVPGSTSQQKYWVYLSNGSSLNNSGPILLHDNPANPGNANTFAYTAPFMGDFDGDGKTEILLLNTMRTEDSPLPNHQVSPNFIIGEKYNTYTTAMGYPAYKARSLGIGIGFDAAYINPPASDPNRAKIMVIDYNGDGKNEILSVFNNITSIWELNVTFDANNNPVIGSPMFKLVKTAGYPVVSHEILTGDFNGDGKTDLLTWIESAGWQIGYGKGNGETDVRNVNVAMNRPKPVGGGTLLRPILLADFNGDGKCDIYDYSPSVYNWGTPYNPRVQYSKGNHNFVTENLSVSTSLVGSAERSYYLGDWNGDGNVDVMTRNIVSDPPQTLVFHPMEKRHMISSIKNGLGSVTAINYQPLTSSTVYTPGTNVYTYPFVKKTVPLKVVASIWKDNGLSSSMVYYDYTGIKYHVQGKGLIGFDKLHRLDAETMMGEEKTFALNTTYAYAYLQASIRKQGSVWATANNVSSTSNMFNIYDYGSKRIFPYLSQTLSVDHITGAIEQTNNTYSTPPVLIPFGVTYSINIGKPSTVTVNKGNGLDIKSTTYEYPNYANGMGGATLPIFVYSKPSKETVTTIRQGQPALTSVRTFSYNNTIGWLLQSVSNAGAADAITSNYWYDSYGNPVRKADAVSGMTDRIGRWKYDPTNRYVIEAYTENFPNIKTLSSFDPLTGALLSATEADGYTTTYTYDAMGRVKTVSDNNGKSETTTYAWASGNPYTVNNASYLIQTSSNTAGPSYDVYDRFGRVLRHVATGFNGQMIFTDQAYNTKSQLYRRTDPYFEGSSYQDHTFGYDNFSRPTYKNAPSGNNLSYSYATVSGKYKATITNAAGQSKSTYTDISGKVTKAEDEGGTLDYAYHSSGDIQSVTLNGSTLVQSQEIDNRGRVIKKTDPNYGSYEYTFSPYSEMKSQKDPKLVTFNYTYNDLGKIKTRSGPEGTYTYNYGETAGPNCGKLIQVVGPGATENYSYGLGEKINYKEQVMGSDIFKTQFTYDSYGRPKTKIYPNNTTIQYAYSVTDGSLSGIGIPGATYPTPIGNMPAYLYGISDKNAFGQATQAGYQSQFPNGPSGIAPFTFPNTHQYDNYGYLRFEAAYKQGTNGGPATSLQNFEYVFEPATGNLKQRKDLKYNLQEDFTFDNLNRLTVMQGQITGPFPAMFATQTVEYTPDQNGNIWKKTDAGTFGYDQANRVSEIYPFVDIPTTGQDITYTSFNKVASIAEGANLARFAYWPNEERGKMELLQNNALQKTKFYTPDYEKEVDAVTGSERELAYVYGPDGNLVTILERVNGVNSTYFVATDYLGSITHIFNTSGQLVEEKSFDAWGRGRNPQTWAALPATYASNGWDRGYTGHEHLGQFGIVNMNGRLYDPIVGRMLSPDPYIMGKDNTQGYNRYSYALNNPLSYNDPDGEWVNFVIGAVLGGISGWQAGKAAGAKGWDMFGYIAGGTLVGLASSGVAAGITSSVTIASSTIATTVVAGASAGLVGGFGFSMLSGRNPADGAWKGALTGGLGALGGGYIGGGWGAFVGGGVASGLNTAFNGGNVGEIGLSAILGGGMSVGLYHASMYASYLASDLKSMNITYGSFARMSAAAQRAPFRKKEFGGLISGEGKYVDVPAGGRMKDNVNFDYKYKDGSSYYNEETIGLSFHVHYAENHELMPSGHDWKLPGIADGNYNGLLLNRNNEMYVFGHFGAMKGVAPSLINHNLITRMPFFFPYLH